MPSDPAQLQPEFYPLDRVLLVGPLADAQPLAARVEAAGHTPTLLVPEEEIEQAGPRHRVLHSGEAVGEDDYDLVLELHCTDLEAKAEALLYLEDALSESVPLLTLTLAISTGELAREMLIPERVAGICLLPPLEQATFVELMATPHTAADTLRRAERLFESLGMNAVRVADSPGGVLGRTVGCLVNEAALALQDKLASAEDIDQAMRLGAHYPYGPLSWGDRIGLDRVLAVMDGLYAEFKLERYRPAPLLKRLVRAGYTGQRARMGFFSYM
jgi:3-hydroxybutyryl-CoA dehydrogenase